MNLRSLYTLVLIASQVAAADPPSGDAVVQGKAGASEIVVATTTRLAGAIHSVTWDGREFIDSADHGRQLQSASSFDGGQPGFHAECFNPTEAGSRKDGAGKTSSSQLLKLSAEKNVLETTSRMAFWLNPGEKLSGKPAKNEKAVSDHLVSKKVTVGVGKWPHAINYRVTFTVPKGEPHTYAQFEAVTGYMPPAFSEFFTLDVATGKLAALTDGPGEQAKPVVFATTDGRHAMGIWSPDQPSKGFAAAGYGRFRFPAEKVVKWNCVFRRTDAAGIPAGDYSYRMIVAVGTTEDVAKTLGGLAAELTKR